MDSKVNILHPSLHQIILFDACFIFIYIFMIYAAVRK